MDKSDRWLVVTWFWSPILDGPFPKGAQVMHQQTFRWWILAAWYAAEHKWSDRFGSSWSTIVDQRNLAR